MEEKPDNYVDFSVKYKDWITIKRLSIDDKIQPEQVSFTLSSIETSIEPKIYKFLGINTDLLDSFVDGVSKGLPKKYDGLSEAMKLLKDKKTKDKINEACKTSIVKPFAETYIMDKLIENMGFNTKVDLKRLNKAFPEYKVKIPKGAAPKKLK